MEGRALGALQALGNAQLEEELGAPKLGGARGRLSPPGWQILLGAADMKASGMFRQLEVECQQNNDVMGRHREGRKGEEY